jgi:hypothetical protein
MLKNMMHYLRKVGSMQILSYDKDFRYMIKINLRSGCQSERSRRPLKLQVLKHFAKLRLVLSMKIYFHFSNAQCDNIIFCHVLSKDLNDVILKYT